MKAKKLPDIQARKRILDEKNMQQLRNLPLCAVHRNTKWRISNPHLDNRPMREVVKKVDEEKSEA